MQTNILTMKINILNAELYSATLVNSGFSGKQGLTCPTNCVERIVCEGKVRSMGTDKPTAIILADIVDAAPSSV